MKHVTFTLALIVGFAGLTACTSDTPPQTTALGDMPDFAIRATGDIRTPVPMIDAAFVPNPIASWASQIVLLSKDGDIWRTNTDGEAPLLISKGAYQDILGLTRQNGAGVFLAAQEDGRASAFVERDDIGNFKPMTVSQGPFGIKAFCNGSGETAAFINMDGQISHLKSTLNLEVAIELDNAILPAPPMPVFACTLNRVGDIFAIAEKDKNIFTYRFKDGNWSLYEGDIRTRNLIWVQAEGVDMALGVVPDENSVSLLSGGSVHRMTIEDGLSIRGLEGTSFVSGTDAKMGSAYNEGVILYGDDNDNRIVMLSLDYLGRVLEADQ